MVCPSDARYTANDLISDVTNKTTFHLPCDEAVTTKPQGLETIGGSYTYLSWVIDKGGDDPADTYEYFGSLLGTFLGATAADDYRQNSQLSMLLVEVLGADPTLTTPAAVILTYTPELKAAIAGNIDITDLAKLLVGCVENCGNGNTDTFFKLREGIERFLITDINNAGGSNLSQSDISVMSDFVSTVATGFNHVPGGANVLFMDGHVEFARYPSKYASMSGAFTVGGLLPDN